jgi:Na+-transporting NADH:ubiquinone oxidoreductase subunit C
MNKEGNTYTFLYAATMVILVAAIVSVVAMTLKPLQTRNMVTEKKQDILAAVNIESTAENAEKIYAETVVNSYVLDINGEKKKGEAFITDLKKEMAKDPAERSLPVFECQSEDGIKYVFPMRGSGLWGPIWGYVSLDSDLNTIYGATFDHEGETPGLGAEITTADFRDQFVGKKIFQDSALAFTVAKKGEVAPEEHSVDGISGGTITSKGVQRMLLDDFSLYLPFLKKKQE